MSFQHAILSIWIGCPKDLDGARLTKKDVHRDRILLLLSKGSTGTSEVSPRLLLSPRIETTLNPQKVRDSLKDKQPCVSHP